jgi:hypothetical protein
MSDIVLTIEILSQIRMAVERILRRFESVDSIDFFLDSEEGLEKLDSICDAIDRHRRKPQKS